MPKGKFFFPKERKKTLKENSYPTVKLYIKIRAFLHPFAFCNVFFFWFGFLAFTAACYTASI